MKNYSDFFTIKRLWITLVVSLVLSFSALLYLGGQIYQKAPPIPNAVQIINGDIVYSKQDIEDGQNIWQAMGGMQQGSIWGHGGYLAPDWSADWLHREALSLLNTIKSSGFYLNNEYQTREAHKIILKDEMRTNTYNDITGVVTISQNRASAIIETQQHYINLYTSNKQEYQQLREDYAFPIKILKNHPIQVLHP
jgi:nitric oxide reductase subunit B